MLQAVRQGAFATFRFPAMATTHHWSPWEVSVRGDSFNSIVMRNKTDMPTIMQKSTNIGRAAIMSNPAINQNPRHQFMPPDTMLNGSRFDGDFHDHGPRSPTPGSHVSFGGVRPRRSQSSTNGLGKSASNGGGSMSRSGQSNGSGTAFGNGSMSRSASMSMLPAREVSEADQRRNMEKERMFGPQRPGVAPVSPLVSHSCLDVSPGKYSQAPRSVSMASMRLTAASKAPLPTSPKCEGGMMGPLRDPFPGLEDGM